MVDVKVLKGYAYNISVNKHKIMNGWYLLITEGNQEYLVRRNYSLTSKRFYSVYQTNDSLKDYIFSEKLEDQNKGRGLFLAIVIPSLLRLLTPLELWFGPTNRKGELIEGALNLLIFMIVFFLVVFLVSFIRFIVLKTFLKKRGDTIEYKGKIKANTPLSIAQNGVGFW